MAVKELLYSVGSSEVIQLMQVIHMAHVRRGQVLKQGGVACSPLATPPH